MLKAVNIILVAICCAGCILPIPHRRIHAYGVRGRIVDVQGKPVSNATLAEKFHSDLNGAYRIPPVYGWHGGYVYGPICLSIWPGWDATRPERDLKVSASGYKTESVTITNSTSFTPGEVTAHMDGAYLRADDIVLAPE